MMKNITRYLLCLCPVTFVFFTNYPKQSSCTMKSFQVGEPQQVECEASQDNMLADGEHVPNMFFVSTNDVELNLFGRNITHVNSALKIIKEGLDMFNMTSLRQTLNKSAIDFAEFTYIPGGHWKPNKFKDSSKVALLVPFRKRGQMLGIFLRHMIPFLLRQGLEFAIFVIEQANDLKFNRGMLANVGFTEALKFEEWDCVIIHDIDFLPRFDQNSYNCRNMPRHFMSGLAKRQKLLFYEFNGVTGFSREQFIKMNGAPNRYWGWGGEDHELRTRALIKGFNIYRTQWPYGYYDHIPHEEHSAADTEKKRKQYRKKASNYIRQDGLSNLKYPQPEVIIHPLYVKIRVNISNIPPSSPA
ncbi:Beta-1,4-galactosyltransferase 6 [Holothuria leucospilota]|uniref:Beta-1,4-galactosyltransferase n=1 Tax=Holothuria leucospilota TaxID=206669 RepID=A0A9Q1BPJ6_HOLLE|nr:Beta-1,4-galactosyltransferase 6 [Holothuria leucospilota]